MPSRRRLRARKGGRGKVALGKPKTSTTPALKYNVYTGEGPVPAGLRAAAIRYHQREVLINRGLRPEGSAGTKPSDIWVYEDQAPAQGAKKKKKGK